MNCYHHNSNAAVSQCQNCGKGLCSHCSAKFTINICQPCNDVQWKNIYNHTLWDIAKFLLIFSILFLVTFILMPKPSAVLGEKIFLFYLIAGWAAAIRYYSNRRSTKKVIIEGKDSGMIYLAAWAYKMIFYAFAGIIILPIWIYRTFKNIRNYRRYKKAFA